MKNRSIENEIYISRLLVYPFKNILKGRKGCIIEGKQFLFSLEYRDRIIGCKIKPIFTNYRNSLFDTKQKNRNHKRKENARKLNLL